MSAKNRAEQLEARKLAKQLGISYTDALHRGRAAAERRAEHDRKVGLAFLGRVNDVLSLEERLRLFARHDARDAILAGAFAELSDEQMRRATESGWQLVDAVMTPAVKRSATIVEQLQAAVRRARLTQDCRCTLDANQVLRTAHIGLYTRWHLGSQVEIHLDELGMEGTSRTQPYRPVPAVAQFEAAELSAAIDFAEQCIGAGTVRLVNFRDGTLCEYLLRQGWSDAYEDSIFAAEHRGRELVRRTPAAETVWRCELASLRASAANRASRA